MADIQDQQITVQSGNEGTGPPPHSHDWDESFYVTNGQIEFMCGGENAICTAGSLVHVPAGTVHAFRYGQGGGEMLEITGRRSNAVQMFTALDREIPPGPPDVTKVIQVPGEHGVKVTFEASPGFISVCRPTTRFTRRWRINSVRLN